MSTFQALTRLQQKGGDEALKLLPSDRKAESRRVRLEPPPEPEQLELAV